MDQDICKNGKSQLNIFFVLEYCRICSTNSIFLQRNFYIYSFPLFKFRYYRYRILFYHSNFFLEFSIFVQTDYEKKEKKLSIRTHARAEIENGHQT